LEIKERIRQMEQGAPQTECLSMKPRDVLSDILRQGAQWQQDWKSWSKRSLAEKVYVYLWADGIYFTVRLEEPDNNRQRILVLMGATADGRKELIAITDGYRESADSWRELLRDVKQRGLETSPRVATGDGTLGFWTALREIYPQTRKQLFLAHKTANILT
jgi:putative transposase